jgi:hypothetical protein
VFLEEETTPIISGENSTPWINWFNPEHTHCEHHHSMMLGK